MVGNDKAFAFARSVDRHEQRGFDIPVVARISMIISRRVLLVFPKAVSMTSSESTVLAWCYAHQPSCRLRSRWNLVRPYILEISCMMDTYLMRIPRGRSQLWSNIAYSSMLVLLLHLLQRPEYALHEDSLCRIFACH
jgi:hypothetical protein